MTKPLKILYHHRVAAQDGQSVHIKELVAAFERLGHEVIFVGPSLRPKALGDENKLLALVRKLLPRFMQETLELLYGMRTYTKLLKAYNEHKPDVLYERYNLFLPAGSWLKRKTGIPYFVEVNAPLSEERARYSGLSLRRIARHYEKLTFQNADQLFPVTSVLGDIIVGMGAPRENITVLHNGINPEEYTNISGEKVRTQHNLDGKIVLGFVGFIREWHRLDRIIHILSDEKTNSDLHLLAVGDGPAVTDCQKLANTLGVSDRVHFVGFQDREAIPSMLAAMDIALQPAVTDYASPLKIFEYMIAGLAIVGPDQKNIREILTHGETGLLFNPNDFETAEQAIGTLSTDKTLRQKIGNATKASITTRQFTWADNARKIAELVANK